MNITSHSTQSHLHFFPHHGIILIYFHVSTSQNARSGDVDHFTLTVSDTLEVPPSKEPGLSMDFWMQWRKHVPLYPSLSSQSQTDHDLAEFSEHKHRERVASRHRKYPPDAGPWHVPTSSLNHIPQLRRSLAPWNSQRFPKVDTQRPKVQFWIRTAMDIQDDIIIQNKIQFAICRLELLSPNQVIKCSLACYLETNIPMPTSFEVAWCSPSAALQKLLNNFDPWSNVSNLLVFPPVRAHFDSK